MALLQLPGKRERLPYNAASVAALCERRAFPGLNVPGDFRPATEIGEIPRRLRESE